MCVEEILKDMPFETIEDLTTWILKYLKDKVVKVNDLVDFFTIVNGNKTVLCETSHKDDGYGEIIDLAFTLLYNDFKLKIYSVPGKVSTYIVREIEVL